MDKVAHKPDTSGNTAFDTIEYDYDEAFRIVTAVLRAIDDDEFRRATVIEFLRNGQRGAAVAFMAAVREQAQFIADEAEFGAAARSAA